MNAFYREDFVWRRIATTITRTSPVIEPIRIAIRIAIAKIIAVGDSPFSTIGVGSIGAIGGMVWLVVVSCDWDDMVLI
jgi:hypothetical protein